MTTRPVEPRWFDELYTGHLRDHLLWLAQLTPEVDSLVSFGCKSSEPFALMWTLDASCAEVVEINEAHLAGRREEFHRLVCFSGTRGSRAFGCMDGRSVQFILGDMTQTTSLPSSHFDLAYCEDVLYQIHLESVGLTGVQSAVNEMARVVKPGGWIIAVEPMIGAGEQEVRDDFLSQRMARPITRCVATGEPIDISSLFGNAGLARTTLQGAPKYTYCYTKPRRVRDGRLGIVTR